MFYLDTSLIVTALSNEAETAQALFWFERHGDSRLITSQWTVTEFASALALKRRIGHLTDEHVAAVQRGWRRMQDNSLLLLPVAAGDFDRAAEMIFLSRTALKAGDALHLAIAERFDATLLSRDRE